jgi:hypothetical protein
MMPEMLGFDDGKALLPVTSLRWYEAKAHALQHALAGLLLQAAVHRVVRL